MHICRNGCLNQIFLILFDFPFPSGLGAYAPDYLVVNKLITADIIKDCFYGRDKVQHSLLEVYAEHNEKCRALIGKEYTASTVASLIHHLIV